MSLKNLFPYLRSNNNEIIDCFSFKDHLQFLRLFHNVTKTFFILDVRDYNITTDRSLPDISKVIQVNTVGEYEEDYSEDLIVLYQVLLTHFPTISQNIIFFHTNHIIFGDSLIFKMTMNDDSHHFHPYLYFNLEWYYENHHNIAQKLSIFQNDFFLKVHQMLNIFLNTFSNSNPMYEIFRKHYDMIEEKRKSYEIIVKLCDELNEHIESLSNEYKKQNEHSKIFSITESENRIFRKKRIREQIVELAPIRKKVRSNLFQCRNELFYHEIVFIHFIEKTKKHLISIQSIQFEFESKIQR